MFPSAKARSGEPYADCSSLFKKVLHGEEQQRSDVQIARSQWQAEMDSLDPQRLMFIDETGVRTDMVRRYGRALRGRRLVSRAPAGHWKTTTFISALRCDRLTAPMVIDGAMNGEFFLAYVRRILLPTLKPSDVVVMDNLACHKTSGVREAIESAGARVAYLPPYSPDFNPIEQVYAKLKWIVPQPSARSKGFGRYSARSSIATRPRNAAATYATADTHDTNVKNALAQ